MKVFILGNKICKVKTRKVSTYSRQEIVNVLLTTLIFFQTIVSTLQTFIYFLMQTPLPQILLMWIQEWCHTPIIIKRGNFIQILKILEELVNFTNCLFLIFTGLHHQSLLGKVLLKHLPQHHQGVIVGVKILTQVLIFHSFRNQDQS